MSEMSPAEEVFFAALEKATPAERAAYLDEACASQPALRARVKKLLAAHPRVGGFLEVTGAHTPQPEAPAGTADYRPNAEPGAVIALMDHPHIAKLLDAGMTGEPSGVRFRQGHRAVPEPRTGASRAGRGEVQAAEVRPPQSGSGDRGEPGAVRAAGGNGWDRVASNPCGECSCGGGETAGSRRSERTERRRREDRGAGQRGRGERGGDVLRGRGVRGGPAEEPGRRVGRGHDPAGRCRGRSSERHRMRRMRQVSS